MLQPITEHHVRNVMLIDDDPATNYINEIFLKKTGLVDNVWKYTQANHAIEQLNAICAQAKSGEKSDLPEIILLDLKMPVMDGFEFLEVYREMINDNNQKTDVYILTSSDYPRDLEKVKQFDIAGIINKPIDFEKGKKIVGDFIKKSD